MRLFDVACDLDGLGARFGMDPPWACSIQPGRARAAEMCWTYSATMLLSIEDYSPKAASLRVSLMAVLKKKLNKSTARAATSTS
jgi:hypothetical protein